MPATRPVVALPVIVSAPVPPEGTNVTLPVPPKHKIWLAVAVSATAGGAALMVAEAVAVHPLASVTV